MTAPYFFRNSKANDPKPYPPPERYGWMTVLVVLTLLVGIASIMWCIAYGNGLPI